MARLARAVYGGPCAAQRDANANADFSRRLIPIIFTSTPGRLEA
jgi:hypothetical protein